MQKYIFKKDGPNNSEIIKAITLFILRSFKNKSRLKIDNHFVENKMLAESDIAYTITDVYSGLNDLRANTILQYYLKDNKHLCADEAIWVCDETEVIIYTEDDEGGPSITFIDKSQFDGNPSYRKLRTIS